MSDRYFSGLAVTTMIFIPAFLNIRSVRIVTGFGAMPRMFPGSKAERVSVPSMSNAAAGVKTNVK